VQGNRHTHTQTNGGVNPTSATAVGWECSHRVHCCMTPQNLVRTGCVALCCEAATRRTATQRIGCERTLSNAKAREYDPGGA